MRIFWASIYLVVLPIVAGCSRPHVENVVLIVIDTLRADHLGCYGYTRETSPAIDDLAARGVRFSNAFATWPETSPSVASLLTGLYPQRTGVVRRTPNRLPERLITLPERLRAAGYQTVAALENEVLTTELGYGQGYETYLADWEPPGEPATQMATRWLLDQRDRKRPFFLYLHLTDPHAPYDPRGIYDGMFVGDEHYDPTTRVEVRTKERLWDAVGGFSGFSRLEDRDELAYYVAQYDAEIRSVDARVGRFLETLHASVDPRRTLIILTADHGEGFGEHNYYWHGLFPYDETSRVPLIFFGWGLEPAVVDQLVTLADITPTILGLLELPTTDDDFDGVSLVRLLSEDPRPLDRKWVYTESGAAADYQRSIRNEDYKLIYVPNAWEQTLLRGARLELYRVSEDPGETTNLADSHPETLDAMLRQLRAWMRDLPPPEEEPAQPVSEETAERIRSLGYVQ